MATIICVHGTFAHDGNASVSPASAPLDLQWWHPGSVFEREMLGYLDAPAAGITITHHHWSGDNSEAGRRAAGAQLFEKLLDLERKNEPYCLIGHSHGGSVISAALLRAAAKKLPLPNLKRWVTVGTPFVNLRKERWLFTRLNLLRKVAFVASMMLLLMFLIYLIADLASGERMLFGATFPGILVATGIMMSLPALIFYLVLRYFDSRGLLLYRKSAVTRARNSFGPRWLSLAHTDDEAIQGLAFLPGAKLTFFDKAYAVRAITALSIIALPLMYLFVLTSPSTMVGIGDWLKTEMYSAQASPEAETAIRNLRREQRQAREEMGQTRGIADPQSQRRALWTSYREKRKALEEQFPNLSAVEREQRFRQRFFERNDQPCAGGQLCGGGRDLRTNAGLLLHVVTDELSWSLGAAEASGWRERWIYSLVVPALLLPLVFGLVALVLMLLIQGIATLFSRTTSYLLNEMTNAEVKRAAFGNDTEGEVAIGALDRPVWMEKSPPRLPAALADLVTLYSNSVASQSFAKFRRAIGQLALAEPRHTADSAITTYFTWKELVHSAYFDVPEFRKLVAQAISRTDGFAPSAAFQSDPDFARTAQWLAEIEGAPGPGHDAGEGQPGPHDAAAVSAVVASTVKAEP